MTPEPLRPAQEAIEPSAPPSGLSPRRRRFCELRTSGLSDSEAGRAAGYKTHSLAKLVKREDVQAYTAELQLAATDRTALRLDWLIDQARDVARVATEAVQKALDAGEAPSAPLLREKTRALELLAKLGGFLTPADRSVKVQVNNQQAAAPVVFQWAGSGPPPEVLADRAERDRQRALAIGAKAREPVQVEHQAIAPAAPSWIQTALGEGQANG